MFGRLRAIGKSQKGFTLNEMLVALTILGVIAPVIGMSIFHIFTTNELSGNHITAVKQVENAVYWISHDTQMAQSVQTGASAGFPLSLTWVGWDSTSTNVTYSIQNGELQRALSINEGPATSRMVAQHVNPDSEATSCQFADGVMTLKVTVSVEGFRPASETRVREIIPKAQ